MWFLYPETSAYKLIGITIIKKTLWISSLSIEMARKPDVRIKNDGIKRQWIMHANENVIDNLSGFINLFISNES